jgi:hypothetical protein
MKKGKPPQVNKFEVKLSYYDIMNTTAVVALFGLSKRQGRR